MADSQNDVRDEGCFKGVYGKECRTLRPRRPPPDNARYYSKSRKRPGAISAVAHAGDGSDAENEPRDPNVVLTECISREAKMREAKAKAVERNWKHRKEEEPTRIHGDVGHFAQEVCLQIFSPSSREKLSTSSEAPTASEKDDISVTPARRATSRLASGALQTPEHLVPALGECLSPRNGEVATEGKLQVYERRRSQQRGTKSIRAKTCPQLRGTSTNSASMRGKTTGTQREPLRSLKRFFTPERKFGFGLQKTPISASQQDNGMLLPEGYRQERRAYFAEVDAFELLEEEADEEEDLGEHKKQKNTEE